MPAVGFNSTISGGERPQTYAFDRAAIGTGEATYNECIIKRSKLLTILILNQLFILRILTTNFN
jgi:hypothetical protein